MSKTLEKEVRADRNYRLAALMALVLTIASMGVSSEWLPLWGQGQRSRPPRCSSCRRRSTTKGGFAPRRAAEPLAASPLTQAPRWTPAMVWSPPLLIRQLNEPGVTVEEVVKACQDDVAEFMEMRQKYLLYR